MARIIKAKNGMSYEKMLESGKIIQLEYDCKVGDVINGYFIMPNAIFNSNQKDYVAGTFVLGIPIKNIEIVETDADLSEYGFEKYNNRWFYNPKWKIFNEVEPSFKTKKTFGERVAEAKPFCKIKF